MNYVILHFKWCAFGLQQGHSILKPLRHSSGTVMISTAALILIKKH